MCSKTTTRGLGTSNDGFERDAHPSVAARLDESELDILRRMKNGDTRALAELYDKYSPIIFAYCVHFAESRGQAEEALMDGFERVWRLAREGFLFRLNGRLLVLFSTAPLLTPPRRPQGETS